MKAAEQPCRQILYPLSRYNSSNTSKFVTFSCLLTSFLEKVPFLIRRSYLFSCLFSLWPFYRDFQQCYQLVQILTVISVFVVEHVTILHSPCIDVVRKGPEMMLNSEMWSVSLQVGAIWHSFLKYAWQMHFSFIIWNLTHDPLLLLALQFAGAGAYEYWRLDLFLSCRFPASGDSSENSGRQQLNYPLIFTVFIFLKLLIYIFWKGSWRRIGTFHCFVTSFLPVLK